MSSFARDSDPTLEAVQFLTGSVNRMRVLETVTGDEMDRRDLRDELGISQPTMSRLLTAFEDRGWVTFEGRTVRRTQLGAFVARTLTEFVERVETARRLGDVARWFPATGFGFDLDRLASAEIVSVSEGDVTAPITHLASRLRAAEHVRALSHGISKGLLRPKPQANSAALPSGYWVFGSAVLDVLRADPEMAARARAAVESDGVEYFLYDGAIPYNVVIADDAVNLCLTGGAGAPNAEIETNDSEVTAWAESTIDEYRRAAVPLTPDLLDG